MKAVKTNAKQKGRHPEMPALAKIAVDYADYFAAFSTGVQRAISFFTKSPR